MSTPPDSPTRGSFSRESLGGVPWMLGSKLVLFVVYASISILTVRMLGKEDYGILALCRNFSEIIIILCAFGLNSALVRFVPELVVHDNKAGLRRLLWKTGTIQAGATLAALFILTPLTPVFDRWFGVNFGPLIALSVGLAGFSLLKSFYNDVFTSLFLVKRVSIFSLIQAALWVGGLSFFAWQGNATPAQVIVVEMVSIGLVGGIAIGSLCTHFNTLDWKSPNLGIGRKRVANLALPSLGSGLGRVFMMKYTETFFLGLFFTPSVVAIYDLGYSSTMLVITFIPMALQTLLTSSLAEAYVKDPDCLPRLTEALYKVLILLSLPLAAFGAFYSPQAVVLFYGEEMAGAGWIASAFCFVHLLPLIATPLSMAVSMKEKVLQFLPLLYFRVGVNLLLDWLLIPRFEIPGAIAAVVLTFALTFPFRLRLIRSILGGFHFPWRFFIRFTVTATLLATVLWLAFPIVNIPGLIGVAALYGILFTLLLRFAKLLRHEDIAEFRELESPKLNRLLDLIVPSK